MAATRSESEQLAYRIQQQLLNRPSDDDMFAFPEEFFEAMSAAHNKIREKIVPYAPRLLVETKSATSSDGGETYDLGDFHLGNMEVYAPPGPPNGERIPPALPDSGYFGFWVDGTTLKLTSAVDYDPLYVRWIPETTADLDESINHTLPHFCEEMLAYLAAWKMAQKPGFGGNADFYKQIANMEWSGDRRDPSDTGILGKLRKQAAGQGFETHVGQQSTPWWRRIT